MNHTRERESRPADNGTATHNNAGQATPTLSSAADVRTDPTPLDVPLLNTMNARGQRIALAYYESGVVAGIEMGRRQADEEAAEIHRRAHAVVQHAARQDPLDVLADRRGEHHRAERQRELLRDRGVTA